jgi:hypothetical protein
VQPEVSGRVFDHRGREPINALANQLSGLIEDDVLRERMSIAAIARAKDFEIDQVAERYLADFQSITTEGVTDPNEVLVADARVR